MNPSLIISIVAVVISALAVGVAIWTHVRSHRLQGRIVALEETREKDRLAEKQKAYLTARLEKEIVTRGTRSTDQYYLVVENKGLAQARSIDLKVDGRGVHEHPCFEDEILEASFLGPKSSFRYAISLTMGGPVPSRADIAWMDDSYEPGKYTTVLTL